MWRGSEPPKIVEKFKGALNPLLPCVKLERLSFHLRSLFCKQ